MPKKTAKKSISNKNKKSNNKNKVNNKNNKKSNSDFSTQLKKMLLDQLISKLK